MGYDSRPGQARTDTTRHLDRENMSDDNIKGMMGYLEGARQRSERFADSTSRLRDIRAEIDSLGREAHSRPTGVLSGGDVDIAYHYLGLGLGVIATFYSILGAIFTLHGGGLAVVSSVLEGWAAGPAAAITDVLLNARTLVAVVVQAILFVVLIGTRRSRHTWPHWAALVSSAAITYAGWNSLLIAYATEPLASFTATIPAALVGGAIAWALVRGVSDVPLPRTAMIAVVVAGVIAGALGVTTLIHGIGVLLAWSADQVARRVIIVG